jgi:hypothetical protein
MLSLGNRIERTVSWKNLKKYSGMPGAGEPYGETAKHSTTGVTDAMLKRKLSLAPLRRPEGKRKKLHFVTPMMTPFN